MNFKVGFGYDIHPLKVGRKLFLGGVEIPFWAGLVGHSDGDGLVHAIIDALLGASGEGDIDRLFPDDDPRYKDIPSTQLLNDIMARLKRGGFTVINVDTVIVAEEPKVAAHVMRMKETLCPILKIESENLGVKAKTNEKLGDIGRGRAIACWAVVLIRAGKKKGNIRT